MKKEEFAMKSVTVESDTDFNISATKTRNSNGAYSISVQYGGQKILVERGSQKSNPEVDLIVAEILKTLSNAAEEVVEP